MDKSYFCFLLEWADMFNILSAEQCGRLIKGMIAYEKDGIAPDFADDNILQFAWMSNIKPKMDALKEHYKAKVRQASEAGKASAEKRKQNKRMLTSVEIVEQNEHPSTDSTNIDLDIDLVKDKKENTLKEKNEPFSVDGMEVIKMYEERFGLVSSYKAQQLDDLVTDFGKDAVSYAVRQANVSTAPGVKYIRTTAMNFLRRLEDGAIKQHTEPNATKPKYGSGIVV